MAATVYLLCIATTIACAALLIRSYRQSRARILLWSGACFAGLAVNNTLLFVDLVLLPTAVDLAIPRAVVTLLSLSLLVFGLIWDVR